MQVCVREVPSLTVSVFGNSDVQRDIGARVYDVLETQIGELDVRRSHQQPMVRQSRGPMGPYLAGAPEAREPAAPGMLQIPGRPEDCLCCMGAPGVLWDTAWRV